MVKPDLRDYTRSELAEIIGSLGGKKTCAARVFDCLYRKNAESFDAMSGISESVKGKLAAGYSFAQFPVIGRQVSKIDGTIKLLFAFHDGATVESVVVPGKGRVSACLSSQAGCACGCVFCATGGLGFKRDLKPSEILGQFAACLREAGGVLNSVVFMGMGEPFLNWDNVKKSIIMLSDNKGYNFPQSKMTVSTVGIVPVIKELAQSDLKIKLAVSIITADEKQRAELVPMEAKYPLAEVVEAARYYCLARKAQVFFEYIIFDGENDSPADAEKFIRLIKGIDCRVNLIPHNPVYGAISTLPQSVRVKQFQKLMIAAGVRTYLRLEKGADIMAACGQLAGQGAVSGA
ncbi:MAG: 23S rRNA (adenine(2503)-C(2))-methyltransferase [Elusimicrobia bacterium GWC2_51_8]|nr:MAG: 23S rRNA (adenine(2503)-C(2))-methyltransferase [Elusimicrobia bacterium GWA2_51_34]OGR60498.1 MAG: 23S rRNA (adenine(2503)-C(2))-methyltransferase [Elusimicrobia bacterium GWC2_51_8]OGR86496.1 MAG: 23S rRNA (adenine(2503)-C(2))-methyltransferase [Elusimicrobia bacterium GWF2_52_66]HAF94658.1 23S rRNA (adenine(2503)-C(2))-methyltransferase RlmN [Elusimicrobiota bacterium]HCE97927.1 23S rRNA (adenine(2503)-C(2))-methyltransferase RlmN [Elusimicrobiota bacterium]